MDVYIYTHPHSIPSIIYVYGCIHIHSSSFCFTSHPPLLHHEDRQTHAKPTTSTVNQIGKSLLSPPHASHLSDCETPSLRAEFAQVNPPGPGMDLKSQMIWFINSCIMSYYLIIIF